MDRLFSGSKMAMQQSEIIVHWLMMCPLYVEIKMYDEVLDYQ